MAFRHVLPAAASSVALGILFFGRALSAGDCDVLRAGGFDINMFSVGAPSVCIREYGYDPCARGILELNVLEKNAFYRHAGKTRGDRSAVMDWQGALLTLCAIGLAPGPVAQASADEIVRTLEIRGCQVTCAAGDELQRTIWASADDVTPAYWGRAAGDAISWTVELPQSYSDLKLGVRYSYAAEHYRRVSGTEAQERCLLLNVDDGPPQRIAVPDTGWWDLFELTSVPLPHLARGPHSFVLTSPAQHTTTNLDCFLIYRGPVARLPAPLRRTQVAESASKRFVLRATPNAQLQMTPEEIFQAFDKIFAHYRDYIGWEPPTPVVIHLIEAGKWDNPGATAYQNNWGVFFRAEVMQREQGNWCHEMTHMFYVGHFPGWFDESSVHTLTTFNWVPTLFPTHKRPEDNPHYRRCVAEARAVLKDRNLRCDRVEPIQYAIRLKYGPDVFRRFFHLCAAAGAKGELDFTPGRHLT
ncbi:MAG: hypothetical protein KKB50_02260, partial [Planctomycetes bacterium]|nr:hypothetical protein [Planctomycetota bacterium]